MYRDLIKKSVLFGLASLLYVIAFANFIHATSYFLNREGADKLPIVMVIIALLVMVNFFLISIISSRKPPHMVFMGSLFFFAINYLLLFFIPSSLPFHAYYFVIIAGFILYPLEISFMNFVSALFNSIQVKFLVPIVYSFTSIGIIIGSLLAKDYAAIHEQTGIGLLPSVAFFIMILFCAVIGYVFKKEINDNYEPSHLPVLATIKESGRYLKTSRLFQYVAVSAFLFTGLQTVIEFKMKTGLAMTFTHETLTQMLGLVYLVRSSISWFISAFLSKRILFRFGVGKLFVFFPITLLMMVLLSIIFNFHYLTAIGLSYVFSLSYFGYLSICVSQALSTAPKSKQQPVYFLLRGGFFAASLLFFSLLMLIYSFDISLEKYLNTIIIAAVAIILLLASLRISKLYRISLVENLYIEDEYIKHRSIDLLAEKSSRESGEIHLRRLLNYFNPSFSTKKHLINSLAIIGNHQTVSDLAKILFADESPKIKSAAVQAINEIIHDGHSIDKYPITKHYLLKAYEHVLMSNDSSYLKTEILQSLKFFVLKDVIDLLLQNLNSNNIDLKTNSIETLASFKDRAVAQYLMPYLKSNNDNLVSTTVIALWQFVDLRIFLIPVIAEILEKKDTQSISTSLKIIGAIKATWEIKYVQKHKKNRKAHIRTFAILTLINLGDKGEINNLLAEMLTLLNKNMKEEIEFILSKYRHCDKQLKDIFIQQIIKMNGADVKKFHHAFCYSKYVFQREENQLSQIVE